MVEELQVDGGATSKYSIVVVGGSLGGIRALELVLGSLAEVSQPIAVALHRHSRGGEQLLKGLQSSTALAVVEVEDKLPLGPGVFLAPADYHLLVERGLPSAFNLGWGRT